MGKCRADRRHPYVAPFDDETQRIEVLRGSLAGQAGYQTEGVQLVVVEDHVLVLDYQRPPQGADPDVQEALPDQGLPQRIEGLRLLRHSVPAGRGRRHDGRFWFGIPRQGVTLWRESPLFRLHPEIKRQTETECYLEVAGLVGQRSLGGGGEAYRNLPELRQDHPGSHVGFLGIVIPQQVEVVVNL